ncbi:MAG: hypothetical protein R2713_01935 [Ilumatobacteraceae bacterium]|nr:hypothetical protein [Acidimicrobiales bacterium]MCB9394355.1 hypothetical protein [Acidimicrobiaceae bacterium]
MKIEGISETSAPQLTGHAFEQMPVRTATAKRTERPAGNADTNEVAADVVVDLHDSAAPTVARQEVEYRLPRRIVAVGSDQHGVIDRNGDGMISLSDLPFDYFQISRQASRKLITPPATDVPF